MSVTCEQAQRLLSSHFDDRTRAERGEAFRHVDTCAACAAWFCQGDPEKVRIMEAISKGNPLPALAYLSRLPPQELERYLEITKKDFADKEYPFSPLLNVPPATEGKQP